MEFREPTVTRRTISLDDLEEGMSVYADVGKSITDAREATVTNIDTANNQITMSLGEDRMDGPYYVPPSNIRRVLSE